MGKSIKTIQDTRMARCQGVATLWDLFDVRCIIRLKNLKNRLRNVRNVQSISEIMDFTWFHESWICVLLDVQSLSDNSLGHRGNIFGTIEFRGMGSQTGPENGVYTMVYTEYILVYPQPSLREDESLDPKPILKAKWKLYDSHPEEVGRNVCFKSCSTGDMPRLNLYSPEPDGALKLEGLPDYLFKMTCHRDPQDEICQSAGDPTQSDCF